MDMKLRRDMHLAYVADEAVMAEQIKCRKILQKLNFADRSDFAGIAEIVKELLGKSDDAWINPPFYCDYGFNISIGKNFYTNHNVTILDGAKVTFGDNVFIAPNCVFSTAGHAIDSEQRSRGLEIALPITVGDNVWIGTNVSVLPGVTIGNNTIIGAGSVVNKNIPEGVIAAGNPCKVIRKITEEDKKKYPVWE
mgnify:CR=1 FL=1